MYELVRFYILLYRLPEKLHSLFVGVAIVSAVAGIVGWIATAQGVIGDPWASAFHTFLPLIAASIASYRLGYTDSNKQGFSSRDIPLAFTLVGGIFWLITIGLFVASASPLLTSPLFVLVPVCIAVGGVIDYAQLVISQKKMLNARDGSIEGRAPILVGLALLIGGSAVMWIAVVLVRTFPPGIANLPPAIFSTLRMLLDTTDLFLHEHDRRKYGAASAYNHSGYVYSDFKQYDKAIADFDRAIDLDPSYVAAYSNRGAAYYCLKQYKQAIADFDHAIALNPNDENAKKWREVARKQLHKG